MRNYIYIVIFSWFFYSCNKDFIDVTPLNELSDETFWKTEQDAYMALVGCYNNFESWSNIIWLDAASDNLYAQHYGWQKIAQGQFLPTDQYTNAWYNPGAMDWFSYSRIRKYNNFLTKVETVEMDEALKERYKAEVRFLRAYDYFYKSMFYGDIPLVTQLVAIDENHVRTPVIEVKQFILDELEAVSAILPVQNNVESGGRITAGAALGLKARLELYMGKHNEAMADSKKVIDMNYELNPDYRGMFLPGNDNSRESILTLNFIDNFLYSEFILQMLLPPSYGGYSTMSVTKSLMDSYETILGKTIDDPASGYDLEHPFKNRDPRMDMTFLHPGMEWNGRIYNSLDKILPNGEANPDYFAVGDGARGGNNILKYIKGIPLKDIQSYGVQVILIRLAEMYLTYAEAAVETGENLEQGLEYLNLVRERAGLPPRSELTRDLIRRERRVEFAIEGLRRFDIQRWDIGATVLNGTVYGSRLGTVDMSTPETVNWEDGFIQMDFRVFRPELNYLFPIPQSEIDVSGWAQNPGY